MPIDRATETPIRAIQSEHRRIQDVKRAPSSCFFPPGSCPVRLDRCLGTGYLVGGFHWGLNWLKHGFATGKPAYSLRLTVAFRAAEWESPMNVAGRSERPKTIEKQPPFINLLVGNPGYLEEITNIGLGR